MQNKIANIEDAGRKLKAFLSGFLFAISIGLLPALLFWMVM